MNTFEVATDAKMAVRTCWEGIQTKSHIAIPAVKYSFSKIKNIIVKGPVL